MGDEADEEKPPEDFERVEVYGRKISETAYRIGGFIAHIHGACKEGLRWCVHAEADPHEIIARGIISLEASLLLGNDEDEVTDAMARIALHTACSAAGILVHEIAKAVPVGVGGLKH